MWSALLVMQFQLFCAMLRWFCLQTRLIMTPNVGEVSSIRDTLQLFIFSRNRKMVLGEAEKCYSCHTGIILYHIDGQYGQCSVRDVFIMPMQDTCRCVQALNVRRVYPVLLRQQAGQQAAQSSSFGPAAAPHVMIMSCRVTSLHPSGQDARAGLPGGSTGPDSKVLAAQQRAFGTRWLRLLLRRCSRVLLTLLLPGSCRILGCSKKYHTRSDRFHDNGSQTVPSHSAHLLQRPQTLQQVPHRGSPDRK